MTNQPSGHIRAAIASVWLALGLAASLVTSATGADAATHATATGATLQLPLEVLGAGLPSKPTIVQAVLNVDASQLAQVDRLWFSCHRCGFFGPPEFEATTQAPARVKASLRVLGGTSADAGADIPWVDITDANVQLADAERLQGGLARGGLYTARIGLVLDASTKARLVAAASGNLIQFRFNGTDGESNGYRVIALQLQDAQGRNLATNAVQFANIKKQKDAGKTWSEDVAAGDTLWHASGVLAKSSIVPRKLQAACASCHAPTGRDLQYFNYSDNAIVQRSRFHGLSKLQGQQIAAYLRYSQQAVPHVAQAAPWNPPYQPGAGLDSRPITEWAAGAGLGAALDTTTQALQAVFGKPIDGQPLSLTQADVDKVMDASATMNTREMAVPLQYPDWNAWLPAAHPLDVWPEGFSPAGSFAKGAQFSQSSWQDPNGNAAKIESWLQGHLNPNGKYGDWSHLTPAQRNEIQQLFANSGWIAYGFLGGGRGNHVASSGQYGAQVGASRLAALAASATTASEPEAATTNAFIERAMMSLLQWNAVQQWHWATGYGLEGKQKWFIGDYDANANTWKGRGEVRGWPFNTVSVFFLAPHMLYQADTDATGKVTRDLIHAWETHNVIGSYYRTNAWYQMQMSINPGAQSDWVNFSMDWPYLTGFDELLTGTLGGATPAQQELGNASTVRLLQARIKSAQFVNNAIPLYVASDTGSLINNRGRYSRAQAMKHLAPSNFMDRATATMGTAGSPYAPLDRYQPGLSLKLLNGAISQFNTLYASTDPAAWRRCDPANTELGEPEPTAGFAFCVDKGRTPLAAMGNGQYAETTDAYGRASPEQFLQYALWKATQMGAETTRLQRLTDWTYRVWPAPASPAR
ncbi:hypothetical protein LRH25_09185 [Ideonella azotifigens]|uniref:Cytochrome c domain-containing protein n=1 Tax=Ideonella azotifigens TaxID=513160 RepID=A0ABP3VP44_9BURK|nr:hypothetical protein [Ideonella azotifigens]MCD2340516.1 hypothetical protein [Ideonella azotifigens]